MVYCRALARYRPSTIESILLQPFTVEGYINFHREICKVASKNERKFEVHLGNTLYHICLRSSPKSSQYIEKMENAPRSVKSKIRQIVQLDDIQYIHPACKGEDR